MSLRVELPNVRVTISGSLLIAEPAVTDVVRIGAVRLSGHETSEELRHKASEAARVMWEANARYAAEQARNYVADE